MGEKFEEDPHVRSRKRSNRRQGIYLKVKELYVVTKDRTYMELYKSKSTPDEEDKPDFSTRKILATNKELAMRSVDFSFGERSINRSHSNNGSELTPDQVRGFSTPSKKQKFLKKAIAKKCGDQVCQLCTQSTDVPWIGSDHESQTGKQCDYWVHATCLGFPEAEDETFQNITFRCPPHNRANITSMNSKQKKTSSLWKQ